MKYLIFFFCLSANVLLISCGGETATQEATADETTIELTTTDSHAAPKKSGILEPVKWTFAAKSLGDDMYELNMVANLDENWAIYSQHTADGGPVPTSFEFESDNFEAIGEVEEKGKKKEGPDPLFDNLNVIKFVEGPVTFTQKVKVTDSSKPITGYLTFMTCDNARCLPPTDVDFEFAFAE